MTINFAGGTDAIFWAATPSQPVNGTISCKCRTTQVTGAVSMLSHWDSSSRQGFSLNMNQPKVKALAYGTTGTPSVNIDSTSSVNDGNWHTITFVYRRNSGNNILYIDGVAEANANTGLSWNPSGSRNMYISRLNGFWAAYVGEIAQIGHWNANLDADEVAALAKDYTPPSIRPSLLIFNAPLIREAKEYRAGLAPTVTGTTVTPHCRMIGPWY